MTTLTKNDVGYASGTAVAAQAAADGSARYLVTVGLRISTLVILPVLFWSGIAAIIF